MQDGIISGNGNSRYLKTVSAALGLYPTYEDFMAALIAGTFPIDLNGINAAGWTQQGTALNKANLLTDATATSLGIGTNATPDTAFSQLSSLVAGKEDKIVFGTYTGNDSNSTKGYRSRTINLGFTPRAILVMTDRGDIRSYEDYLGGLATSTNPVITYPIDRETYNVVNIVSNGFNVYKLLGDSRILTNDSSYTFVYMAFK